MVKRLSIFFRKRTSSLRALPDFVVIGVQKGGTKFLYHCLSQHPEIKLAISKEVHYFDQYYHKGLNWYKAFFPLKKTVVSKCVGEITPRYLINKNAPSRCHKLLPNAKIIVLLRNPVDRAFSHYNMTKRRHGIDISFEEYVQRSMDNETVQITKKGKVKHKKLNSLKRGLYSEQIQRWEKYYPKENILFIESEVLFSDPESALGKINQFLNVAPIYPDDLTPQHTGGYTERIKEPTRELLNDYFRESNEWLRKEGFELSWLKD